MRTELVLLDQLTSNRIENEEIKKLIDLISRIDWDVFFEYIIASKTICIVYNCLVVNHLEQYIPAKIHKMMSQIFLGNQLHNEIISREIIILNQLFVESKIKFFQYKNLVNIYTGLEENQMPNDIDYIVHLKDFKKLRKVLKKNNYIMKSTNKDLHSFYSSAFFVKLNTPAYYYPLKVDVIFNLIKPANSDKMLFDLWTTNDLDEKNALLMIINFIETFNNNPNCIFSISDYLKMKRMRIQYFQLSQRTLAYINTISKKYGIEEYINKATYVFDNFLNVFTGS